MRVKIKSQLEVCGAAIITERCDSGGIVSLTDHPKMLKRNLANAFVIGRKGTGKVEIEQEEFEVEKFCAVHCPSSKELGNNRLREPRSGYRNNRLK